MSQSNEIIKICIVEDNTDMRTILSKLVQSENSFELVGVYKNGIEALKNIPTIETDIVLMDINMPMMNGIECVKALNNLSKKTQYLMCTILEDDDSIFNALAAGANGYLLKNSSHQKIKEAIIELYNGGAPMSTSIARKVISEFKQTPIIKDENPIDTNIASLTQREFETLELLAKGFLYKEIAHQLDISVETVRRHIHNIYKKLHVANKTEAVNRYFER